MDKDKHPIFRMSKEEVLRKLLAKEVAYYKGILELTEQENHLLKKNPTPSALASLGKKKQILLSCVEEIDIALTPIKRHWDKKSDKDDPDSKAVQAELETLNTLVQSILALDQENQTLMQALLTKLRDKQAIKG